MRQFLSFSLLSRELAAGDQFRQTAFTTGSPRERARVSAFYCEHVYPRAPSLRQALPSLTDGQIFTYINDGIRNTAMPAWDLPEKEIWQIVAFLRHLPPTAAPGSDNGPTLARAADAHYVGSTACESCHKEIYDRWR